MGERIKSIRKERKLTQKVLGELCGMNESHIRTYESGKHLPSIDSLIKLAQALEVPPWELMDLDGLQEDVSFALNAKVQNTTRVQLLGEFDCLNTLGQRKVVDYAKDLSRLKEYQKSPSL